MSADCRPLGAWLLTDCVVSLSNGQGIRDCDVSFVERLGIGGQAAIGCRCRKYMAHWFFFVGSVEIPPTRKFVGHDILSIQRSDDKRRDVVLIGPLPQRPTRMMLFDVVFDLE